jgi:GAF domain-containing protein
VIRQPSIASLFLGIAAQDRAVAQAVIAIENARLLNELRQRTTDLMEVLEQQTATSDVLKVISGSPGDLQPVFEAMLDSATRICHASLGTMSLHENGGFRHVALHGAPPAYAELRAREPVVVPKPTQGLGRLVRTKQVVHIADILSEPPEARGGLSQLAGARTLLIVPMLKDQELVGSFGIYRQKTKPFTEKQIELVQNFAAQAVIAIENARLLNELRQRTADLTERTADLTEALDQQTATSEVLRVISGSPGDLQPVFASMLENAVRICDARFGIIFRWEDDALLLVATHNTPSAFAEFRRRSPLRSHPQNAVGRAVATKKAVHVADLAAEQPYTEQRDPGYVAAVELGGVRTFLAVPMLMENELIGLFTLYRQEVRPFTDKQIALVTNFAAQAVIAIENARLLNELKQSLEQQTATSQVLQVISSSQGDLEPVFQAILENATRICDAKCGFLYRYDGRHFSLATHIGAGTKKVELMKSGPITPDPTTILGRIVASRKIIEIEDATKERGYLERHPVWVASVEDDGARGLLGVPMLKNRAGGKISSEAPRATRRTLVHNALVGAIVIFRPEVRPFTEKQIELVKNFANHAVIAIENARLLNELRQRTTDLTEALEQQTATSEVLQVISSSPGELEPVFATMLEKAARLCDATFGNIFRWDGEFFNLVAAYNTPPAFLEVRRRLRLRFGPKDPVGRMLTNKNVVHIADLAEEQDYIERSNPGMVAAVELGGIRTHVVVPLLKDDELIGTFHLSRQEVRPFTDKQIELVTNFAAQAVLAIENTRLLKELRERTEEVEKLNQHLEQRVSDQVGEIERMRRLRRFLPPQVADLIVASGSEKQLESHRREIAALFCDLRGFTGFTESSDAEDVMALLRDYHAAIGQTIIKYGGTLERFAGDGVMVIFNDPVPVENPALQAVLMALEVRDALGALTATWSRLGHEIGFGIGIAHGFATLGTIGFEGRFDYAAIGTVSNVASRLCDEAKPGQILISPRVLMKVEDAVEVEPVGEFELKGIRRPLAAYNVVAAVGSSG